jgi:DNA-binding transcriptional LysR family regulator
MHLDWSDLQLLLALYRSGSQTGAAEVLQVNPTTVGRRLAAFEQQIGAPLLIRGDGGYSATVSGEAVLEHALQMEQHARLAENQILGAADKLEGRVRISTTADFASSFLVHHLDALREAHPEIMLEMMTSDGRVDIDRGEADIAIRFNPAGLPPPLDPKSDAQIQRLRPIGLGSYASAEYLEKRGSPERSDVFTGHDIIVTSGASHYAPPQSWLDANRSGNRITVMAGSLSEMAAAAVAGYGIAVLPAFMVQFHPALSQISPPMVITTRETWLMVPAAMRRVQRVRIVHDYLCDLMERAGPALSGTLRTRRTF